MNENFKIISPDKGDKELLFSPHEKSNDKSREKNTGKQIEEIMSSNKGPQLKEEFVSSSNSNPDLQTQLKDVVVSRKEDEQEIDNNVNDNYAKFSSDLDTKETEVSLINKPINKINVNLDIDIVENDKTNEFTILDKNHKDCEITQKTTSENTYVQSNENEPVNNCKTPEKNQLNNKLDVVTPGRKESLLNKEEKGSKGENDIVGKENEILTPKKDESKTDMCMFKTPEKPSEINKYHDLSSDHMKKYEDKTPEKNNEIQEQNLEFESFSPCDEEEGMMSTTEQARLLIAASKTPSKSVLIHKTPIKQTTPNKKRLLESSPGTPEYGSPMVC